MCAHVRHGSHETINEPILRLLAAAQQKLYLGGETETPNSMAHEPLSPRGMDPRDDLCIHSIQEIGAVRQLVVRRVNHKSWELPPQSIAKRALRVDDRRALMISNA